MADKKQLYKDEYGQRYAIPEQPSFDTMQKVGIPNYRLIESDERGSHVRSESPENVYFSKYQADNFIGPSSPGVSKKDVKEKILAHELQHQLSWMPRVKGQAKSMEDSKWRSSIDEAWVNNADRLGLSGRMAWKHLGEALNKPEVQARLKEMKWPAESRLIGTPKDEPLKELLADLSSLETTSKIDLTKDPVFNKHVFNNDDRLKKLYKSTSGMSGVVIGDSDYAPYSLEAGEAWHGRDPSMMDKIRQTMGFRHGGIATLAQHVKAAGRNGDSMLVHMTPGEVAGLQKLAKAGGGSLTTNPHTGLPEAGFLSNMLPTVVGIGVGAMTGNPWLGAAVAGGLGYAETGSIGKGIMSGIGAYGGTDMFSGLSEAGATNLTAEASRNAVANVDPNAFSTGVGSEAGVNSMDALNAGKSSAEQLAEAQQEASQKAVADMQANPPSTWAKLKASDPMSYLGQNWKQLAMTAAPVMSDAMKPKPANMTGADPYSGPLTKYHLASDFQGYTPPTPNPYYKAQGLGYAGGGVASLQPNVDFANTQTPIGALAANASYDANVHPMTGAEQGFRSGGKLKTNITQQRSDFVDQATLDSMPAWERSKYQLGNDMYFSRGPGGIADTPSAMQSLGRVTIGKAAGGGISSLGGYSDGGRMLKGPGDGMSDSIPASISGKQPARLADGEFVVPADVVSHLGNGSTDAGAKQLYKMMDKVRRARTGNPKQGKQIKAEKFMPKA